MLHTLVSSKHVRRFVLGALLIAALFGLTFSAATPAAAQFQTIPVARWLNPDGTLNTRAGMSGTLDLRGWNVMLDSKRGPVLSPQQLPSAQPPNLWSALPHKGLNNYVHALAVSGSDVYVGGDFHQTYDGAVKNLNRIAKFSGGTWSALPHNGLNSDVYALAVSGADLYVGGHFSRTYDGVVANLNHIAKFDTNTSTWSALSNNGLDYGVTALALSGSDLYVGGDFSQTYDGAVKNLNNIAKFDGTNWSAFPHNGLDSIVQALAVSGSDLYVGGQFRQTYDGAVTNLNYIARFDTNTSTWSALPHNGLIYMVQALAVSGTDLYVGGWFDQTADGVVTNLNNIAKFDTNTSTWYALPNNGLNSIVYALAVSGTDLYVGGQFTQTYDGAVKHLNSIAKFDTSTSTWSALPHKGLGEANGLITAVLALAVSGTDLYVGGWFDQTADGVVTNLNNIAQLCGAPTPLAPPDNATITKTRVTLDWSDVSCATSYTLKVKDTTTGTLFLKQSGILVSEYRLTQLTRGHSYTWRVKACNGTDCVRSVKFHFTVSSAASE